MSQQYVRFLISNKVVPVLIGQDGSQIKKMASDSGAGIAIETVQNLPFKIADAIPQRVLTIFFDEPTQLAAALTAIIPVIHDARLEAIKQAHPTRENLSSDIMFQALGHKSCVFSLLQDHGKVLRALQEQTGTQVSIKPTLRFSSEAPINIRGPDVDSVVAAVVEMIPNLTDRSTPDEADASKKYRRYSSVLPYTEDDLSQRKIYVKTEDVAFIIGKQGQRINFIHKITGCSIKLDTENEKNGKTQLTLNGPSRNIVHALSLINLSKMRNHTEVTTKKPKY